MEADNIQKCNIKIIYKFNVSNIINFDAFKELIIDLIESNGEIYLPVKHFGNVYLDFKNIQKY